MTRAAINLTRRQRTAVRGAAMAGLMAGWLGNRLSWLAWHVTGDVLTQWTTALANAGLALQDPLPSLMACDLLSGLVVGAAACRLEHDRVADGLYAGREEILQFFRKDVFAVWQDERAVPGLAEVAGVSAVLLDNKDIQPAASRKRTRIKA